MNDTKTTPPSAPAAGSGRICPKCGIRAHADRCAVCIDQPLLAKELHRDEGDRQQKAEALCAEIDSILAAHRVICPEAKLLLEATKVCLRGDTKRAIEMVFGPLDKTPNTKPSGGSDQR